MVIFKKKDIFLNKTLGERLKGLRLEAKLSPEDLTQKIGISKKYIIFLEESKYENLPGEVYVRSFLKKYARALDINEEQVLAMYEKEKIIYKKLDFFQERSPFASKKKIVFSPFTPKFFRNLIIILLILVILIYLGWEISKIISPPKLSVDFPLDKYTTREKNLEIQGSTEAESKVLVNGKEVFVGSDGKFKEEVVLEEGVNIIKISAYKKQGKERTVTREVMLENNL
jgi:cytoskeletal protein RodZ